MLTNCRIAARLCVCVFIVWLSAIATFVAAAELARVYEEGSYAGAILRYQENVPVVVLSGSAEDRGRQHGLVGKTVLERLISYPQELYTLFGRPEAWQRHQELAKQLAAQIPAEYRAELRAMAAAAEVPEELVLSVNTLPDIYRRLVFCSSLMVSGSRSTSGEPIFGRNLDFPGVGKLHQFGMVMIYPAGEAQAFATITFPGFVGCVSGMNASGLALAVHEATNKPKEAPLLDPEGTPYGILCRQVLERCSTVDEAVQLFRQARHTTPVIIVLCDRLAHAVVEVTPGRVVVRREEDGVAACTNHFRTELAGSAVACGRYRQLLRAKELPHLSVDDVAAFLHKVHQGDWTIQSMIFEPATLRLRLAIGRVPASAGPFVKIDLGPLFRRAGWPSGEE